MSASLATIFLQGTAVGLAVAAPVGPIGVLCMKRTIERGPAIGLATGMGAAVADAIYGGVAALGLAAVARVLVEEAGWLSLAGGLFLIGLAAHTLSNSWRRRGIADRPTAPVGAADVWAAFATTVPITLSNPSTILTFAGIFAATGLGSTGTQTGAGPVLVAGVFIGSAAWWLFLVSLTSALRHRLSETARHAIDMASGAAFLAFGVAVLWRAFV